MEKGAQGNMKMEELKKAVTDFMEFKKTKLELMGVEPSPLMDTVGGMLSLDYKERFKAEYRQTLIRWEKLKNFCNRIEAAEMTEKAQPKHDCPVYLLREQQRAMGEYLHIMELRAVIEEIELEG